MSDSYYRMISDCQKVKPSGLDAIRIYLDTSYMNRSYYSDEAKKYLELAERTDPSKMQIPNWDKLNTTQKKDYINRLKSSFLHKADSINALRNIAHFVVENHTTDSIEIILSDFSLLSIIEAKNNSGEWKPIEYWGFSDCMLSIKKIRHPPFTKRFAEIQLNPEGNFKTKGRLRAYINYQIVYSEEFDITIDDCQFIPYEGNELNGFNWFAEDKIPILNERYKRYRLRNYGECP